MWRHSKRAKTVGNSTAYGLEDHKIEKDKILMVGDSETDILAAKNAGIRSAFFKYGYNGGKQRTTVNHYLSRLDSLVKTKA